MAVRGVDEAGAEDDIALVGEDGFDEPGDEGGAVLAIGVEMDDDLGVAEERVVHAGLEGCSLAEVAEVAEGVDVEAGEEVGGWDVRTVVNNNDGVVEGEQAADGAREDFAFVIGGNYDENVGAHWVIISVRWRTMGPWKILRW